MEPIFSYAFKDAVNELSSEQQFKTFFKNIYHSDDAFIVRDFKKENRVNIPIFAKMLIPLILYIKPLDTTTYFAMRYWKTAI